MNPLYKAIGMEIHWALLEVSIDSFKKDPRFSLAEFSKNPTFKQNAQDGKKFLFALVNAIKEGVSTEDLKKQFLDQFFEMATSALRKYMRKGLMTHQNIQESYDAYRAIPALRNLSERDFYLFLTHTMAG